MKAILQKTVSLLLVCTALFALSSCGKTDGTDMSFSYPIPSEPATLDPQVCADMSALTAVTNLYEGLVRIGSDGSVTPGAAEKMDVSSNGLVYTFTLRSGLKWHLIDNFSDILGENFEDTFDASLKARDFVFGLRRTLSPATASSEAASLYVIKNAEAVHTGNLPVTALGVAAPNDRTVVITLSSASVDFLSLLALPVSMPCNEAFFNACKGKYGIGLGYTMCNGPFYLSKWTSGSSLLIKRNADYIGGREVLPYSFTLYFNPNEVGYAKKVAEGVYDAAPCGTGVELPSDTSGCIMTEYQNTVWGLCLNCDDALLSNLYVRLALCGAFDRAQLGFADNLTTAKGLLPLSCRVGSENFRQKAGNADFVAFNTEKALSYWKAGLKALELSSASLTVLCTADNERPVRRLIQFWQQAFGISVSATSQVVELADLQKAVGDGSYQLALAPVTASSACAAVSLTDYAPGSEKNIFKYKSDNYSSIVTQTFRTGSTSSAAEGCRTAESYLMQNGAVYPFYETSGYLVLAEHVSGIYADPSGKAVCFISAIKAD